MAWVGAANAAPTPLVTGNGFGFAVFSISSGTLTKLYAHPYSFERPDPKAPLAEGAETPNFIRSLSWTRASTGTAGGDYVDQSHVISAGNAFYFMPFGLHRNALIALNRDPMARLKIRWAHPVASDQGSNPRVFRFKGITDSVAIVRLSTAAWAFLPIEPTEDVSRAVDELRRWRGGLSPQDLVARELQDLEAWRAKPEPRFRSDDERRLWRQSEAILRMAQIRETNRAGRVNHGLIVACLPDGSWFMTWARDMAFATEALIRMGHRQEARWAIEAYFNARPVGKMREAVRGREYQISVARYFGDGSEEPFFTQEGSTNIELDDWGLALKTLGDYVEHFGDESLLSAPTYRGSIYGSAKAFVAEALIANLEPFKGGLIVSADTSIWEERQKDKKHFAFSTAAAIAGLRAMKSLAHRMGDGAFEAELGENLEKLVRGFAQAFAANGRVRGALEPGIKNDVDGAALIALNLIDSRDRALIQGTVDKMPALKTASGGYRRVTCILKDPKIFEYHYERQEFLFVNFHLAEAYLRLGKPAQADAIVDRMVQKAAGDHFMIPEMYVSVVNPLFKGDIGAPTGVIPIVGYGAGAYIYYLLERDREL